MSEEELIFTLTHGNAYNVTIKMVPQLEEFGVARIVGGDEITPGLYTNKFAIIEKNFLNFKEGEGYYVTY